jgi:hypothetical protein
MLLAAAGAAHALVPDALSAVDACIARLDPSTDIGYARIASRCPDLTASLSASPWAPLLPPDWSRSGNLLSAGGLAELRTLLSRAQPAAPARALPLDRLNAVLAGLKPVYQPPRSWWARFKEWLHRVLEPQPGDTRSSWLRRLFDELQLSRHATDLAAWAALAVLVALAVAILLNELRVAGLLKGGAARRHAVKDRALPGEPVCLAQVQAAALCEQPRLLLQLIIARLRERNWLPPARSLTVHELARAARLPHAVDYQHLQALAGTCEQARFARVAIAPAAVLAALESGRELLADIETAAAEQPVRS